MPGRVSPTPTDATTGSGLPPTAVLWILVGQFLVLAAAVPLFYAGAFGPPKHIGLIGGLLPVGVPWGGALGGVCNAIAGQVFHWFPAGATRARDRAVNWNAWRLTQILLGAAFGGVAPLIVVLFLRTIDTGGSGLTTLSSTGVATLFVIAFVVGYRQDIFRQLVERVATILLAPGGDGTPTTSLSVASPLDLGSVTVGGTPRVERLAVTNRSGQAVQLPPTTAANPAFTIAVVPGPIPPGGSGGYDVTFTPTAVGQIATTVSWTTNGELYTADLIGTGVA